MAARADVFISPFPAIWRMNTPAIALGCVPIAVAGAAAWGAVNPGSQLFGPTLRRTKSSGSIALTFDDGPNPSITPVLLDLLERHSAHATFFVIGRFARACPDLVREIAARGHAVGNHTDTHAPLAWLSAKRIGGELARCQEAVAAATQAQPPAWMRPPFGFRGPQLRAAVRRAGLAGVAMWSLTCFDWKPQPAAQLIARLGRLRGVGKAEAAGAGLGGEIVLLHDGDHRALGGDRTHVVTALEYWLPRWRDQGVEFVTIDEVGGTIAGAR
jgi:peptidoglycan/xylan/chitin deacetylase (PgdA/CDA1 family)